MTFQYLLYEVKDKIATITLNRPDRMNALVADMYFELIDALDAADKDPGVRVIVVQGQGVVSVLARTWSPAINLAAG